MSLEKSDIIVLLFGRELTIELAIFVKRRHCMKRRNITEVGLAMFKDTVVPAVDVELNTGTTKSDHGKMSEKVLEVIAKERNREVRDVGSCVEKRHGNANGVAINSAIDEMIGVPAIN